jgi:hypothetical protein
MNLINYKQLKAPIPPKRDALLVKNITVLLQVNLNFHSTALIWTLNACYCWTA